MKYLSLLFCIFFTSFPLAQHEEKQLCDGIEGQPFSIDTSLSDNTLSQIFPSLRGISPEIIDSLVGSFTGVGRNQQLYLVQVNEDGLSARNYFGTYRLAVVENGEVIFAGEETLGNSLWCTSDVNYDGVDEIAFSSSGFGQGVFENSAQLGSFVSGQLKQVVDLGYIDLDTCGTGLQTATNYTKTIYHSLNSDRSAVVYRFEETEEACE